METNHRICLKKRLLFEVALREVGSTVASKILFKFDKFLIIRKLTQLVSDCDCITHDK